MAAVVRPAGQGRDHRRRRDRHPGIRQLRRGQPVEPFRPDPVRRPRGAATRGRADPRGDRRPGPALAAPCPRRRARRLGRRGERLLAARPVHRGHPGERPPRGDRGRRDARNPAHGHRGEKPVRAHQRRRVRHHPVHGRRGAVRRDRGGEPERLRGLHPRPGRTRCPPPPRRGAAAHRPRAARRGGPHHGHHQRAGRGGRPRAAHPPGGGRRVPAGDQDREQGGAQGTARHPERAAPGRRRRPDPAGAGHRPARGAHRGSLPGGPGDNVHRDRRPGAAAVRGGPGRLPDHPGIADQHHPARRAGHRFGNPRLRSRRAARRRDRHRPGPAGARGKRRRPRARRNAGARRRGRRYRRSRSRPGRRFPGRGPAAP